MHHRNTKTPVRTKKLLQGFTIVELLIVIVVIAILAAITILAFNGIQAKAVEATLKSDLKNGATQLGVDNVNTGSYPADIASVNGGKGLKASNGTTFQYTYTSATNSFCLTATSSRAGIPAFSISTSGSIQSGACPGHAESTALVPLNGGVVTTFAGSGYGYADGTGSAAQFANPYGVAVDSSGVVYVADSDNHRIRKITPAGVVTTLAGSTWGFADGSGSAAQFNGPTGVAVDSSGVVYVADNYNDRIRKITPAGVVTTLAGSTAGFADGSGSAAQFNGPADVAVDSSGVVYVADSVNHRIRKITPAGVVTTLAGSTAGFADGSGSAAQFKGPLGVAVDSSGVVYVGDHDNYRIRKITPAGVVTTLAGSIRGSAEGTGSAAQFYTPAGVAVDSSGAVYVADWQIHRIRVIK